MIRGLPGAEPREAFGLGTDGENREISTKIKITNRMPPGPPIFPINAMICIGSYKEPIF